jgi:hypothetical protein
MKNNAGFQTIALIQIWGAHGSSDDSSRTDRRRSEAAEQDCTVSIETGANARLFQGCGGGSVTPKSLIVSASISWSISICFGVLRGIPR